MASNFLSATIVIVVSLSVNCAWTLSLNTNRLQNPLAHNHKHDQENFNGNMVKDTRQFNGQIRARPRPPPLRPDPQPIWSLKSYQNHFLGKASTQERIQHLQDKLNLKNIVPIRTINHPHPKPDVAMNENKRPKREVIINPQIQPEMVMQPYIQTALQQNVEDKYQDKMSEMKRDKRQILFILKQPSLDFVKKPRTTPNPFIRETNIADYDIIKPDVYKPEVEITNSLDTDSNDLNEKATELSNILSNFYLTTSLEHWAEFQKFADNVVKPLSELWNARINGNQIRQGINKIDLMQKASSESGINRRVKRKLDKTLIRKRAKKRKQKQRRVERKRLRMLTHARRLRKQRKSKLARLERHYARMNLTTTAIPEYDSTHNGSNRNLEKIEKDAVTIMKNGKEYTSGSSAYTDSESGISIEYFSDSDESDSDSGPDNGNDVYEEYDEDSSTNSFEYVDYETVTDASEITKVNKNASKKSTTKNKKEKKS